LPAGGGAALDLACATACPGLDLACTTTCPALDLACAWRRGYRSQELGGWKRGWVTAWSPFNVDSLLRQLALQLEPDIQEDSTGADEQKQKKKNIGAMEFQEMVAELSRLLETKKCLVILDDLSSTQEWDAIKHYLANARRIIITTTEKLVAKHCSEYNSNMFSLLHFTSSKRRYF